ncbi:MAG: ankyrin repeat domain-containing protein, partial [Candidatus Micrarchaeia archaeon]
KVNAKDEFGDTALMLAAENGHFDIVKLLVENGAKLDRKMMIMMRRMGILPRPSKKK